MTQTHTKNHRGRIYLPTFALNILPVVMHITVLILLFIFLIIFIQEGDWSWYSIKMYFVISIIVITAFYQPWWIVYFLIKRNSAYVFVKDSKLILQRKKELEEFTLDSIDHFSVVATQSFAGGFVVKRELFLMDKTSSKKRLHCNDFGNKLGRSYERFGKKLQDVTGKEVRFVNYVESMDGEILEAEEALQKEVEKTIPFLKRPHE